MSATYLPLCAERKCLRCGEWRGQHYCNPPHYEDSQVYCRGEQGTFVPGPRAMDSIPIELLA